MTGNKNLNKLSLIALCATMTLSYGCSDEDWRGNSLSGNSDRITYTLVAEGNDQSRAGGNIIGQETFATVSEDGSDSLYIHPYIADMPAPGAVTDPGASRATPIRDMDLFTNKVTKFSVHARTSGENKQYINDDVVTDVNKDGVWDLSQERFWPEGQALDFYGVAPAHVVSPTYDYGAKTMSFSYETPSTADNKDAEAQTDIMFAYTGDATKGDNGRANLTFKHALAGIRFKTSDITGSTIKTISLKNVYGAGNCVFDCANNTFAWTLTGEATNTYTQTFDITVNDQLSGAQQLTDQKPECTFMMIPQTPKDVVEIEVTLQSTVETDGAGNPTVYTLKGKIATAEWEAGKIYTYTISSESINWQYVFEVVPTTDNTTDPDLHISYDPATQTLTNGYKVVDLGFTVKSYRYRTNDPNYIEPLAWKATDMPGAVNKIADPTFGDYSGELIYREFTGEEWLPELHALFAAGNLSGDGSVTADQTAPFETSMRKVNLITSYYGDEWMRDQPELGVGADGIRGTADDVAVDLSMYDCDGNPSSTGRNTANCYTVHTGGCYKFPVVYGNMIKDGATNMGAIKYSNHDTSANLTVYPHNDALHTMVNYNDKAITDPWLQNDLSNFLALGPSAGLMWEDAYQLIHNVKLVQEADGKYYVYFEVDNNYIQEANALIGVYSATERCILWSWHIWVTNLSLNAATTGRGDGPIGMGDVWATNKNTVAYYLAPRCIGYCHPKTMYLSGRDGYITFKQYKNGTDRDADTNELNTFVLHVEQLSHTNETAYGNNPYFQYGRKDPFPGVTDHGTTEKYLYTDVAVDTDGSTGLFQISVDIPNPRTTIGRSIKEPNKFIANYETHTGAGGTWCTGVDGKRYHPYRNLWNNHRFPKEQIQPFNNRNDATIRRNKVVKTIYDPSPIGFVLPPCDVFRIVFGNTTISGKATTNLDTKVDPNGFTTYNITYDGQWIYTMRGTPDGNNIIEFEATGQRWYNEHQTVSVPPGKNWAHDAVYLWTADSYLEDTHTSVDGTKVPTEIKTTGGSREISNAFHLQRADGVDQINTRFAAAMGMARPCRPIKETSNLVGW